MVLPLEMIFTTTSSQIMAARASEISTQTRGMTPPKTTTIFAIIPVGITWALL
jgi:hypothetical protein